MGDEFRPVDASLDDQPTQTIELTELFTRDLTVTGSFDVRSEIWKSTFGKVIQALPIPTLLIGRSFRIVGVNQAWGKINLNYEELRDTLFSHLFPEASIARKVQSLLEDVFSTRKPVVAHGTLEMGNSRIWARMTFRSIRVMEERFILVLVEDLTADKQIVEHSKKHGQELEQRVEERTSELMAANAQLKEEVAERKRVEMALRESEERYRLLAENSLTGIYVHQDDKFVYVNKRAAETMGYTENELIGKSIWEVVAPEDREMTKGIVAARLQRKRAPSHYQFRILTRNGEVRWIEVLATAIEHNGRPATLANALDITARKHAEEALRQSEASYRELFENSSDIVYTHDLEGRYKSVNEAARRILGYSSEEFLTLTHRDVVDPDHIPITEENLRRKIENGVDTTGPYEIRVRSKDGTPFWFEINSRIIRDNGKPIGVHGTARDITDRKKAEEALRESEEKYRLVVKNASEAIFVVQDGMLKFVNPRTLKLAGCPEHELTSRPFAEFIHRDDRAMVLERHEQRIKGQHPPSAYTFRVVDNSGNIKWVEINVVPVLWERKAATLNFLVDITAKRKMEEELVKVEKLESLGVLAGGIAHDFNNILTAILGNISLAKMHCEYPDKVKERLIEAEKACSQAQGLTQQLLTFSKGGAPIKRTSDISQLIEDSCHFAVRGSSVRCELSVHNDLFTVDVDEGQIGQVLNNLVINSVHAMPRGGVIHVHAKNIVIDAQQGLPLPDGNYVKIVVNDDGVGIPKNILPRIFDPYFTTKHKESGLGLATSYSIIRNHDGLITAESEVGVGTTFCVYLPASQRELQTSFNFEETTAKGSGRILLMDDEDSIREVAKEILSTLGYEVELARDGTEAISLYRTAKDSSHPFDVVVLDLTVPGGMGGAEAIERLREIDPEVKAVVSSGYSNDPIMSDYTGYGFRGVVAKPYTAKELGATLRAITTGDR
ncbi:MAG TPA: PAS domain S-box protein [Desulfomonilaceae bacterium]|nr:PAS domain S-box protein [Desulfomonilaceae bacterium]